MNLFDLDLDYKLEDKNQEEIKREDLVLKVLESFAVGKDNALSGDKLMKLLYDYYPNTFDDYSKVRLQADIRKLRLRTNTYRIGSSPAGYWLMTEDEFKIGLDFIKKLAISHIKTAINQGVSSNYFHQALNELEVEYQVDKQINIEGNTNKLYKGCLNEH